MRYVRMYNYQCGDATRPQPVVPRVLSVLRNASLVHVVDHNANPMNQRHGHGTVYSAHLYSLLNSQQQLTSREARGKK